MVSGLPALHPHADPAEVESIVALTRRWLERAVIGLNLCPFAKAVYVKRQLRLAVTAAATPEALLEELAQELTLLERSDAQSLETTLLIHPRVLTDFLDFNDFLDTADGAVQSLGLEGVLQVASFHPQYRFADSGADDIENYSNRAPFPILHLLREESIDRAVEAYPDPAAIYGENLRTLRRLGHAGWQALFTEHS